MSLPIYPWLQFRTTSDGRYWLAAEHDVLEQIGAHTADERTDGAFPADRVNRDVLYLDRVRVRRDVDRIGVHVERDDFFVLGPMHPRGSH